MGIIRIVLTGILVFAFIMAGANKISNEVFSEYVFTNFFSRTHTRVCTEQRAPFTDKRHQDCSCDIRVLTYMPRQTESSVWAHISTLVINEDCRSVLVIIYNLCTCRSILRLTSSWAKVSKSMATWCDTTSQKTVLPPTASFICPRHSLFPHHRFSSVG